MKFETILYEVDEGILTITLNRPERLNAFNNRMRDEVISALDAADADDNVKAIIFTGSGRAFCAGADLGGGGDTLFKDIIEFRRFSKLTVNQFLIGII